MNPHTRAVSRTTWVAVRAMVLLTVLLGVLYTAVMTGIGQLALPAQANGSIVTNAAGEPVGSALLGQNFADDDGAPLPQYFQPRPSAAEYDGADSSGSNQGPENPDLIRDVAERKAAVAAFNGVPESDVPADALTASSSGLDPHISVEYATIQIDRVAQARGLPAAQVRDLVAAHTHGPDLGYLGQSRMNVLELNIALDQVEG